MRALLVASAAVAAALAVPCLTSCSDEDRITAFTVWAFEESLGTGVDGEPPAGKPLAGAEIAFDPPGGGSRVILNVAPDGHATFEGDFTLGRGAVTVFDREHVLVSVIEVSPEAVRVHPNTMGKPPEDLVVLVPALDDVLVARTVEVRGALSGKRDPTSSIDLSASGVARLGSTETVSATYALRAPRGRPFFMLAHETKNVASEAADVTNELVGSFRVDMPALDADTVRDLDVTTATRLATRSVHLRAVLPTATGSPFGLGTRSSAIVVSADSRLLLAPIESARASNEGRSFDLAMAVAETEIAPERPLTRVGLVASDGSRSVRLEPGVAAEGTTFDDFLAPPRIVAGISPTGLNEPILVEAFPAGAELAIEVFAGPQLAWVITAPARDAARARDPIHVPVPLEIRLPALVAVAFSARTDHVPLAPRGEVFRRVSFSRDVLFRR